MQHFNSSNMAKSGLAAGKVWCGKATADKFHVWNGTAN